MAENPRTAKQASIKRASAKARRSMNVMDDQVNADLTRIYRQAVNDLEQDVNDYADGNGTVRLDVLQELLAQARARLTQLERAKLDLMDRAFIAAAQLGVQPFAEEAVVVGANLTGLANDAVQFVRNFVAEDGLQLSDRIWRNDRHARRVVQEAIEQAVIQGHSAAQAAENFLSRGVAVPADVQRKMGAASADRIAGQIGSSMMRGEGAPFDNAIRLFRTEINRAHGEAYQAAAFEHPDVIGTRFLLSPNHPKTDICDMHARVNRWGLGPGVYPKGKNPWPAHPNTLSFVEVVFDDEVSKQDRADKEDRIEWLNQQPPGVQESVLNSRKKRAALDRGILIEGQIATPWKVLKKRFERRGIDTDELS